MPNASNVYLMLVMCIYCSADVKVPPGEYDIYTFPQLHDSLAQLITDNLDVRTWLFKIDHEFDGRHFDTN